MDLDVAHTKAARPAVVHHDESPQVALHIQHTLTDHG